MSIFQKKVMFEIATSLLALATVAVIIIAGTYSMPYVLLAMLWVSDRL